LKKFEFRLASVLRLRETQLEIEKNRLHDLFAERSRLQKKLISLGEERTASEKWLQSMAEPTSADLRSLSAFLLGSKSREATLQHSIQSCHEDIARQRKRTVVAERNQKLLLNLRAKQKEGWQKEFDKELEEVAQEAWQAAVRAKQET
jgi:flagellar export protein FliJ